MSRWAVAPEYRCGRKPGGKNKPKLPGMPPPAHAKFRPPMYEYFFEPQPGAPYDLDYPRVTAWLNGCLEARRHDELAAWVREFSQESLFFFCYFILGLRGLNHPWLVARVREVQAGHDSTLDLWFRESWKSTLLSYALPIWQIAHGPEITIGLFSHSRAIAKGFLRRIKTTLETNRLLSLAWPHVFYGDPVKQSPKWSEDDGLIVRRKGVYAEATIEAWGVVDSQPTSKHFSCRIYDDVVVPESVATLEQIAKTRERFELSHNLGRRGGEVRVIGTRYDYADLYGTLIDRGGWKVRRYPATDAEGNPILHTPEELAEKRRQMGSYIYSAQMELNPLAREAQVFRRGWFPTEATAPPTLVDQVRYWDRAGTEARKARPGGSWTAGVRMATDRQGCFWILDVIRFQGSPAEVEARIQTVAAQDGQRVRIGIEQDPGAAGKAEAEGHARRLAGYDVRLNAVHESKGLRARPFAAQAETGNVRLLRGAWNDAYLQELERFDGSEGCMADQVDASSGAFLLLSRPVGVGVFKW